jgi:hypothetical protein
MDAKLRPRKWTTSVPASERALEAAVGLASVTTATMLPGRSCTNSMAARSTPELTRASMVALAKAATSVGEGKIAAKSPWNRNVAVSEGLAVGVEMGSALRGLVNVDRTVASGIVDSTGEGGEGETPSMVLGCVEETEE